MIFFIFILFSLTISFDTPPMTFKGPILIFDGSACMYRSIFALPVLRTSEDVLTSGVIGTIRMIGHNFKKYKPSHVYFVMDGENNRAKRIEIDPQYKATRMSSRLGLEKLGVTKQDLVMQTQLMKEFCDEALIPCYNIEGDEADDVIATLCKKLLKKISDKELIRINPYEKYISNDKEYILPDILVFSPDKDLYQVLDNKNSLKIAKGKNPEELMGWDNIVHKLDVKPDQFADWQALVGDSVDNIKGVPGIGPKKASEILRIVPRGLDIFENLSKLPKHTAFLKMHLYKDLYMNSLMLTTLYTSLNLENIFFNRCIYNPLLSINDTSQIDDFMKNKIESERMSEFVLKNIVDRQDYN
eukprot:GHVL01016121.1.p1 GENE.GHVL01016121.1~~GHVL01016121.1.p1  ORF type:complete len:357 (+),score=72.80 GHVL01016121.1:59-1129(+)